MSSPREQGYGPHLDQGDDVKTLGCGGYRSFLPGRFRSIDSRGVGRVVLFLPVPAMTEGNITMLVVCVRPGSRPPSVQHVSTRPRVRSAREPHGSIWRAGSPGHCRSSTQRRLPGGARSSAGTAGPDHGIERRRAPEEVVDRGNAFHLGRVRGRLARPRPVDRAVGTLSVRGSGDASGLWQPRAAAPVPVWRLRDRAARLRCGRRERPLAPVMGGVWAAQYLTTDKAGLSVAKGVLLGSDPWVYRPSAGKGRMARLPVVTQSPLCARHRARPWVSFIVFASVILFT